MATPFTPGPAEYVAGEMTAGEAAAFARRLASDPSLQREVDFWRRMRSGLAVAEVPAPPSDLAAVIARRAELATAPRRLRLVSAPTWIAVAAAVVIGIALGWSGAVANGHRVEPIAWLEDGSAVLPPHNLLGRRVAFMPQAAQSTQYVRPATTDRNDYPWLGVWIKPVEITAHEIGHPTGHLVVMVAQGSPAAAAGIVPGDLIVGVAGCALCTPLCIAHALRGHRPGESIEVVWWQAAGGQRRTAAVTLGSLVE